MESGPVWEGNIGTVHLRVEVPHAGRIHSEWDLPQGRRRNFSRSLQEFERNVLFQVSLASGEKDTSVAQEVLQAVAVAEAERPAPRRDPPAKPKKRSQARRHRRSRTPPRRR